MHPTGATHGMISAHSSSSLVSSKAFESKAGRQAFSWILFLLKFLCSVDFFKFSSISQFDQSVRLVSPLRSVRCEIPSMHRLLNQTVLVEISKDFE